MHSLKYWCCDDYYLLKIKKISLPVSFSLRVVLWWQSVVHQWLVSAPDALVQLHNTPGEPQQHILFITQKHSLTFILTLDGVHDFV